MAGRRARFALVYGTAALVAAADQLTKWLVVGHLAGRPPVRLLGSFVELRYTTNSGGAFSVLTGAPLFFALTAILVIGAIVWSARRPHRGAMLACLGLLLAVLLSRAEGERPNQVPQDPGEGGEAGRAASPRPTGPR